MDEWMMENRISFLWIMKTKRKILLIEEGKGEKPRNEKL